MATTKNSSKAAYELEVDGYKCTLSEPNRFVIAAAMAAMIRRSGEMDMAAGGEIVFNSCKVTCDPEIEKDDVLLVSMHVKCFDLVEIKEVSLKKI